MANDRTQRIAASLVFTVPSKVRDEILNKNLNLLVRPTKRTLIGRHNQNLLIGLQLAHREQICIKGRTHCACSLNAIVSTRVSSSTYSRYRCRLSPTIAHVTSSGCVSRSSSRRHSAGLLVRYGIVMRFSVGRSNLKKAICRAP